MYKQEEQHLSDEDLFKYLSDFKSRERYLNKLISICGEIDVNIRESSSSSNSKLLILVSRQIQMY